MKKETLTKKVLPQNPEVEVLVPNYKEPILPIVDGYGWYGLQSYNKEGQLMCHECGVFMDNLGNHIRKHGLRPREYRKKYGLMLGHRLVSHGTHLKISRAKSTESCLKHLAEVRKPCHGIGKYSTAESYNKHGTCSAQLLSLLSNASEVYGKDISKMEANKYRPGLSNILRERFGSFNKAKQLINLVDNQKHVRKYSNQIILEDMCTFNTKYHYWPDKRDYVGGRMIFSSYWTLFSYGGIKYLRQEAMRLKEEQDTRVDIAKKIPKIANNIEMESAGFARR